MKGEEVDEMEEVEEEKEEEKKKKKSIAAQLVTPRLPDSNIMNWHSAMSNCFTHACTYTSTPNPFTHLNKRHVASCRYPFKSQTQSDLKTNYGYHTPCYSPTRDQAFGFPAFCIFSYKSCRFPGRGTGSSQGLHRCSQITQSRAL
jgi:hypothetical protein